jgi:hypothetical protein
VFDLCFLIMEGNPMNVRPFVSIAFVCLFIMLGATAAQAMKDDPCYAKFKDRNGNLRPDKVKAYVMHEQFEIYRKADRDCDGHLSAKEIAAFESDPKLDLQIQLTQTYVKTEEAAGRKVPLDKNGEPPLPIVASIEPTPDPCPPGWHFLLRNSFEDIGTFSCPKDFKSATGAQFGFTSDGITHNKSFTGKGVAALEYVWRSPVGDAGPYLAGYALSPWTSFNVATNSLQSLKSKEVDLLSFGGTGEVALAQILDSTQYLRLRPQYNTNFDGIAKSWSTTAEWQPVSNELGLSAPRGLGPYLVWEVDPILRTIYSNRLNGSLDPIFATRNEALRIGPVVALTIAPVQNDAVVAHWLQTASFSASYEYLNDVHSGRNYGLFNTAVNLPVDSEGHLAFQVAYQNGNIEETGGKVNLITVGLAAKW